MNNAVYTNPSKFEKSFRPVDVLVRETDEYASHIKGLTLGRRVLECPPRSLPINVRPPFGWDVAG